MKKFTEKSVKGTIFALLVLIALSLSACDTLPGECSAYLEAPFRAEVEGEIDGEHITATVFCDPTEHKTKEIYNKIVVTFTSGKALNGITVSLRSDRKATIRLRGIKEELPLYSGFVEPFISLTPDVEPYSVRKTEEGYEVEYREKGLEVVCYFDKDGMIKKVEGKAVSRQVSLNITKFEQIPK